MPKNRPTTGQTNWGDALNAHLNQLTPSGGGVNYGTTRPTLTTSDDGYTMVDTSTKEIIRWNGTVWEVLLGGFTEGKPRLNQDTDLFINGSIGNDSNSGRTATKAFKTFSRAVREAYNLDINGFALNIRIASGTYTEMFDFTAPVIGASRSTINIIGSGPDTILQAKFDVIGSNGLVTNSGSNLVSVSNLKFQATGSNGDYMRALLQYGPGRITISENVNFGNFRVGTNSQHMFVDGGGVIYIKSGYVVSGGATVHLFASTGGRITTYTTPDNWIDSTFNGSNILFDKFAYSELGMNIADVRFTGTAVATVRAEANYNGVVLLRSGWPGTVDNQYNGGVVAG